MADPADDLVAALIQNLLAAELRAYQGNLAWASHVVQNGWLPVADSPEVQEHLRTLRQYLTDNGQAEDDDFLLRLGLAAPGTQRGIVPPFMVLETNRGGFSARRQREAEGQVRRLREALSLGQQLAPRLSSDTQQALAELLSLSSIKSAPTDLEWLRWFQNLSSDQVRALEAKGLEYLNSTAKPLIDLGTELLQRLACFRHSPLSESCCVTLIERSVLYPPSMFRDAGDAVAELLIAQIEQSTELHHLNQLLMALAWTRSTAALNANHRWNIAPPSWTATLHVPPADYLHDAGWSLENGTRRDLISLSCFRLVPANGSSTRRVPCRTPRDEHCPACGSRLLNLFDFSKISADFLPGELAEAPRKVPCCLSCAYFEPIFSRYDAAGHCEWLAPVAARQLENAVDSEPFKLELEASPCPPFAHAQSFGLNEASTLGGMPMWLQDAEFPRCLECGKLMTFLAQHDNARLGEEGIHYAFFCADCHVVAVTYQQT